MDRSCLDTSVGSKSQLACCCAWYVPVKVETCADVYNDVAL